MKTGKQKITPKVKSFDESEKLKPKKKMPVGDSKVNVKSLKFWDELYENEGDDIEKYIR